MALSELLVDFESKLSGILGGATTLSNPSEHFDDPLVQVVLPLLAGQAEIDKKIDEKFNNFNIKEVSCDCLEVVASLAGYYRRNNKVTTVGIVIVGSNNTIVPTGTVLKDNLDQSWTTDYNVTIDCGIGFTTAHSMSFGYFPLLQGELVSDVDIPGVSKITNGFIIENGYVSETCEQFRSRILSGGDCVLESEENVFSKLLSVAKHAKVVNDYPLCDPAAPEGCKGRAFVVRGGNDTLVAEIIRKYAPVNYASLVGNTTVVIDCEPVKIARPCPVGIEIEYTATEEIDDSAFQDIICQLNESLYLSNFSDLKCLTSIKFKTRHVGCDIPASLNSCDETYNTAELTCPCPIEDCTVDDEFKNCAILKSWEIPIFISATYLGVDCEA